MALGLSYSAVVPSWEASDEDGHFAYARYLLVHRALLRPGDPEAASIDEKFQPPLYYLLLLPALVPFDLGPAFAAPERNPYLFDGYAGFNYALHPAHLAGSARSTALALQVARALSVLLNTASLLPVYLAARRIWPGEPTIAWAATCLYGFWPQFLFLGSMVTNDGLVTALAAALFYVSVKLAFDGFNLKYALAAGSLLGAALLTKLNAVGLIPLVAIATLIGLTKLTSRRPSRPALALLLLALILAGVLAWLSSQEFITTQILQAQTMAEFLRSVSPGPTSVLHPIYLLSILKFSLRSFLASFGWGNLEPNAALYWAWALGANLALVGLCLALIDRVQATPRVVLLLAALQVLGVGALVLALDIARQAYLPGRYLLPSLPGVAFLGVTGLRALAPSVWRRRLWQGLCLGVILAGWSIPVLTLAPAYAKPRPLPSRAAIDRPLALTFGGAIELIGYQRPPAVVPGQDVRVTLCWQAISPPEANYPILLELTGPDDFPVARLEAYPGNGNYPTSLWPVGVPFCDPYIIPVRGNMSLPPELYVHVSFLRGVAGERLPVQTSSGNTIGQEVVIPLSP